MKWPLFEKIISKRLSARRPEVEAEALWAAIEPGVDAINRRRRRRRGAIWWFLLGALLLGGLAAYWQLGDSPAPRELAAFAIPMQGSDGLKEPLLRGAEPIARLQQEAAGMEAVMDAVAAASDSQGASAEPAVPSGQADALHFLPTKPIARPVLQSRIAGAKLPALTALPLLAVGTVRPQAQASPLPPAGTDAGHEQQQLWDPDFRGSVSVQLGLGITQRSFSARPGFSDSIPLRALREQSERVLENVQAGLLFNLSHHSGLEVSTGIHFTRITERYEYRDVVSSVDSVFGVQSLVVNLYDEVDTVYGMVPLEKTTRYNKRYYNRYNLLEIPLILGYQAAVGQRFKLGAQAGVFANLQLQTQGRILASADSDLDVRQEKVYKASIGASFRFGLLASYQLGRRTSIYLSPAMRYFPQSFTRESYPLEQRYQLYQANVGLRYYW